MLFSGHTLGACLPLCEVPQQISWNFLKMHLLCMNWRLDFMQTNWLFFDVSGKVLSLIRFANDPYTRLNRINASRFAPFRKTRKHVNRGQTQCWALFVISKATFTKTAIKPNLDDRFSLKNFDTAIDQCTIKCINLDCLEFSKTSNSYAAREHWPWLVALRNLFSLLRHYRKPLVCIGLTHERFCSWSMFQAHFARPVHKRVHTAGACSMLWYTGGSKRKKLGVG